MKPVTLAPTEVLSWPHEVDLLNSRAWHVRWDHIDVDTVRRLVDQHMPETVNFQTSGSTGVPTSWQMRPQDMLAEMVALSGVLGRRSFDGVLAFAPPQHRYGAHCSVLLPAVLGCPAWVRPRSRGSVPSLLDGHWLIVAIPSTFAILSRRLDWLRQAHSVTILHSSASLPAQAHELLRDLTDHDVRIVELLGSTETGAVATRHHPSDDQRWELVPGVSFAHNAETAELEECPLEVESPWLARSSGQDLRHHTHRLDDLVQVHGDRHFSHIARTGRILKINGVRHDLDDLTSRYSDMLGGRRVTCLRVQDAEFGEHFDLVVAESRTPAAELDKELGRAVASIGVRPRQVRFVAELPVSSTGKTILGRYANNKE